MAAEVAILSDLSATTRSQGGWDLRHARPGTGLRTALGLARGRSRIEVVGEGTPNLFALPVKPKTMMNGRSCAALASRRRGDDVAGFRLRSDDVRDGGLVETDGEALTFGDIKAHIRLELAGAQSRRGA